MERLKARHRALTRLGRNHPDESRGLITRMRAEYPEVSYNTNRHRALLRLADRYGAEFLRLMREEQSNAPSFRVDLSEEL
ncbi:MAG TPA: hypothetical protein VFX53_05160 [Pedococcus sp.]|nr:hypothetical protein [Pedococcus sp.]